MPETTPLIKAALNLRVGAGFDVYDYREMDPEFTEFLDKQGYCVEEILENISKDGLLIF